MKPIRKFQPVLLYKLVRYAKPGNLGDYGLRPQAVMRDPIEFDEVCRMISARSLLCDADVYQVMEALLNQAVRCLMDSEAFPMGELGYLTTVMKSDLVDDPAKFRPCNIRSARVVFRPSAEFRRMMKREVVFKRVYDNKSYA